MPSLASSPHPLERSSVVRQRAVQVQLHAQHRGQVRPRASRLDTAGAGIDRTEGVHGYEDVPAALVDPLEDALQVVRARLAPALDGAARRNPGQLRHPREQLHLDLGARLADVLGVAAAAEHAHVLDVGAARIRRDAAEHLFEEEPRGAHPPPALARRLARSPDPAHAGSIRQRGPERPHRGNRKTGRTPARTGPPRLSGIGAGPDTYPRGEVTGGGQWTQARIGTTARPAATPHDFVSPLPRAAPGTPAPRPRRGQPHGPGHRHHRARRGAPIRPYTRDRETQDSRGGRNADRRRNAGRNQPRDRPAGRRGRLRTPRRDHGRPRRRRRLLRRRGTRHAGDPALRPRRGVRARLRRSTRRGRSTPRCPTGTASTTSPPTTTAR